MRHTPYRARQINPNTYVVDIGAVCYPYLLLGTEKALLIDAGMGEGNLREYLETITDLPIEVVNTHAHFDHTLCDGYFDKVWMSPEAVKEVMGISAEQRTMNGKVPDFTAEPVSEGHVFDLGGRHIEVLETPCHSPGDLMFLDHENRMLFTGDNLEAGQVLIFYGNAEYGATVAQHLEIMKKIEARMDEFDTICPAHNGAPLDKSYVTYFIENDQRILDGIEGTADLGSPSFNVEGGAFGMDDEKKAVLRCSEWKGTALVYDVRRVYESKGLWNISNQGV